MIEGPRDDVNVFQNILPRISSGWSNDQRQLSLTETSQKVVCPGLKDADNFISHTEFMYVASKLSNACRRNKNGTSVSAFMLQMLEISQQNNPESIHNDIETNLQTSFPNIIAGYKTSFKSIIKGKDQLVSSVAAPKKSLSCHNARSKWLIPAVEKIRKVSNAKRIKSVAISICEQMPKIIEQDIFSFLLKDQTIKYLIFL